MIKKTQGRRKARLFFSDAFMGKKRYREEGKGKFFFTKVF